MPPNAPPRINPDEPARPQHTLTASDLDAIAKRCEERKGLAFGPESVPLVAEALRALARERRR